MTLQCEIETHRDASVPYVDKFPMRCNSGEGYLCTKHLSDHYKLHRSEIRSLRLHSYAQAAGSEVELIPPRSEPKLTAHVSVIQAPDA